ncbi:MAG: hypothetical protein K7J15_00210, partial [Candidatus Regiella insecticola]|nr:hypothetical protein [Candidatus Regiella insecticola]
SSSSHSAAYFFCKISKAAASASAFSFRLSFLANLLFSSVNLRISAPAGLRCVRFGSQKSARHCFR